MQSRRGYTIVEALVVIGILAVLGVFVGQVRRPHLATDARSVAMVVGGLRSASIATGASHGVGGAASCGSAAVAVRFSRTTARVGVPPRGLLFTPDGLPRACDGGGVGNTTILLEHRGRQAAVIVSALGRVRWELR